MGLAYNTAYHLRCQLTLASGRTVTLEALDQEMTYSGLMEGVPNDWTNDHIIECALDAARRHCADGAEPHLLTPSRRDYLREPGDMRSLAERRPHHVPEWLPMVRCVGSFKGIVPARDPGKDWSVLTVVWFQDEYAMPISELALGRLLALDWDALATDITY